MWMRYTLTLVLASPFIEQESYSWSFSNFTLSHDFFFPDLVAASGMGVGEVKMNRPRGDPVLTELQVWVKR